MNELRKWGLLQAIDHQCAVNGWSMADFRAELDAALKGTQRARVVPIRPRELVEVEA